MKPRYLSVQLLLPLITPFLLVGCIEHKTDDLETFVVQSKIKTYPVNDKIPTLQTFKAKTFTGEKGRNPFSAPKAEVIKVVKPNLKNCHQPDFERARHALEMYSLDNLKMRGIIKDESSLHTLIETPEGKVYQMKVGYYLGLNYGKITKINKNNIKISEQTVDKNGCWHERMTQLSTGQ
jgi:type IV pilus assembly protein PilP